MRRDTITVQGFLLECFCTTAMFIVENVVDGKKLKFNRQRGEGGGGSWNKNVLGREISKN